VEKNATLKRLRIRCAQKYVGKKQGCKAVINMDLDKRFYNDNNDVHTCS
jgi:hypothetical protein